MLIRCESCSTVYQLDESLLPPGGAPVQCTRCQHVFTAFPPQAAGQTQTAFPTVPPAEPETNEAAQVAEPESPDVAAPEQPEQALTEPEPAPESEVEVHESSEAAALPEEAAAEVDQSSASGDESSAPGFEMAPPAIGATGPEIQVVEQHEPDGERPDGSDQIRRITAEAGIIYAVYWSAIPSS